MTLPETSQDPEQQPRGKGELGGGQTSLGQGGRRPGFEACYISATLCDFRFIPAFPGPQFSHHEEGSLTQISKFPLSVRAHEQTDTPPLGRTWWGSHDLHLHSQGSDLTWPSRPRANTTSPMKPSPGWNSLSRGPVCTFLSPHFNLEPTLPHGRVGVVLAVSPHQTGRPRAQDTPAAPW